MPESLTRRDTLPKLPVGVRLQIGMVSGFASERRPASTGTGVRHRVGLTVRHQSESPHTPLTRVLPGPQPTATCVMMPSD